MPNTIKMEPLEVKPPKPEPKPKISKDKKNKMLGYLQDIFHDIFQVSGGGRWTRVSQNIGLLRKEIESL